MSYRTLEERIEIVQIKIWRTDSHLRNLKSDLRWLTMKKSGRNEEVKNEQ
jgi:hypothetical protein